MPTPDFPLFPHDSRQWAKKIGGKMRYFGLWSDPDGALAQFQAHTEPDHASSGRSQTTLGKIASSGQSDKPKKPYRDFPLYAHKSGQWAKKVRGKVHYFSPWSDPDTALRAWIAARDDLLSGRERRKSDGLTLRELVNEFLNAKETLMQSGELPPGHGGAATATTGYANE